MNPCEDFLDHYSREYEYYDSVARVCSEQCEALIQEPGIQALVTYRAKRHDGLAEKVEKRNKKKKYKTTQAIYDDIVDLAGVRIALYFPGDRDAVGNLIASYFDIEETKNFPVQSRKIKKQYKAVFRGYSATHYRVRMKIENLQESEKKYASTRIEIQVASVLMHAWSEVEHDLVYKPATGDLSEDEYAILDELNGLVLAGEIALQRLQGAVRQRQESLDRPFTSQYDLAFYLHNQLLTAFPGKDTASRMNNTGMLYKFLELSDMNRPTALAPFIKKISLSDSAPAIPEQILQAIVTDNEQLYSNYVRANREDRFRRYARSELFIPPRVQSFVEKLQALTRHYDHRYGPVEIEDYSYPPEVTVENDRAFVDEDKLLTSQLLTTYQDIIQRGDLPDTEQLNFSSSHLDRIITAFKSANSTLP